VTAHSFRSRERDDARNRMFDERVTDFADVKIFEEAGLPKRHLNVIVKPHDDMSVSVFLLDPSRHTPPMYC